MTHTGATIHEVSSAVDRAEENSLNRRAAKQTVDELGLGASVHAANARAEEIKAELCGTPKAAPGLVVDLARELYDRFVMGGWEPQDAYPLIGGMLHRDSRRKETLDALGYALECLTRPEEVDVIYRMEAVRRIKEELRRGQR